MTKPERIAQHKRLLNRYARAFRKPLKDAMRQQLSSLFTDPDTPGIDAELSAVIQRMYVSAALGRANMTLRELNREPMTRKAGSMGFDAQWTADVINYFRMNLFSKVVLPISQTTRDYIRRVILEGTEQGWSIERMRQEIERVDYLDGRVERILRTEINRGVNYGNQLAAGSYDFQTQKEWIAVHDNRTRHPHLLADGQVVAIDGAFQVGGELLDFPGDPAASGNNTINCRCTSAVVPIRDGRGRLIPKDTGRVRIRGRLRRDLQSIINDLQI